MFEKNCNSLISIPISIIISFLISFLFYNKIIINISPIYIFSLIISLFSLFFISLFGISDNGLTRQRLCNNYLMLIISILGNIAFSLLSLTISLSIRKCYFGNYLCHF